MQLKTLIWLSCRYVAVYFTLLHFRKQKGIVTKEMLAVPKKQFLGIGAIEALSSVTGFISAAKLPGKRSCFQSAGPLVHVLLVLALRASCTTPLFLTPGSGKPLVKSFHRALQYGTCSHRAAQLVGHLQFMG